MGFEPLGDSVFNYTNYSVERFIHYYQQIDIIMRQRPKKMLEIGPGDYTVTDFFMRKGVIVKTLDNDPKLKPNYLKDIRGPLNIDEKFDLILASEVFEHMKLKWLDIILYNLKQLLEENGVLLISIPYSTIKLFPKVRGIRLVSNEGRLTTNIPMYYYRFFISMPLVFKKYISGMTLKNAFNSSNALPEYPDDHFNDHHWDLGYLPATRKTVKKIIKNHFIIIEENVHVNTNSVIYLLRVKH